LAAQSDAVSPKANEEVPIAVHDPPARPKHGLVAAIAKLHQRANLSNVSSMQPQSDTSAPSMTRIDPTFLERFRAMARRPKPLRIVAPQKVKIKSQPEQTGTVPPAELSVVKRSTDILSDDVVVVAESEVEPPKVHTVVFEFSLFSSSIYFVLRIFSPLSRCCHVACVCIVVFVRKNTRWLHCAYWIALPSTTKPLRL
jgi:hypothetical protein